MPRIGAPDDRAHHEPRNLDNHPMPRIHETHGVPDESTQKVKSINDILDWLSSIFGFQVSCVLNVYFLHAIGWEAYPQHGPLCRLPLHHN
jgi:hypothetical protein